MKRIIPYILMLLLGIVIGNLLFKDIKITKKYTATGFQIGVFSNMKVAKEYSSKFNSSLIIKDNDVYRVYYSILTNNKTKDKMRTYLDSNKITYYEKDLEISKQNKEKIKTYEENMLTASEISFKSLNNLILESYGDNN